MKNNYIIDKEYSFPDNDGSKTSLHLKLEEEEVLEYASFFINNEDEYEVDSVIKDALDEANATSIAENLFERWKDSIDSSVDDEDSKSIEDFYDDAWELLGDSVLYYCWCEEFKNDCIRYYQQYRQ